MELKLFYMGDTEGLNSEQIDVTENFINAQMYGTIATNNPDTSVRLSCLANMPKQTVDKLYYATDSASRKAANIKAHPRVEVLYTDGDSQLFLTGKASIVNDKQLRHAMWNDMMYYHFPEGPDGENFCLIEFLPDEARIMLAAEAEFENICMEQTHIAGIGVRTSNAVQQTTNDIGNLWKRFWEENIIVQIPEKISDDLYAVYTEYEGDATAPYTIVIGCAVRSTDKLPEGMKAVTIESGNYAKNSVKGKMSEGIIQKGWMKIWQSKLNRKYQADFELYKCNGFDPDNAEVDIFVGIK